MLCCVLHCMRNRPYMACHSTCRARDQPLLRERQSGPRVVRMTGDRTRKRCFAESNNFCHHNTCSAISRSPCLSPSATDPQAPRPLTNVCHASLAQYVLSLANNRSSENGRHDGWMYVILVDLHAFFANVSPSTQLSG